MSLLTPTLKKRFIFFLLSDITLLSISLYFAFLLRFDFDIPIYYDGLWDKWLLIILMFKLSLLYISNIYNANWRYISVNEFISITKTLFISTTVLFCANLFLQNIEAKYSLPKSVILIDFLISLFLILALRVSKRVYEQFINFKLRDGKKALIIGAGSTGERVVRELLRESSIKPIGFLDDDKNKLNSTIHNIRVIGKLSNLANLAKDNHIELVIIAIRDVTHIKIREIYELCKSVGVNEVKIVPNLESVNKEISFKDIRDINLEDLLSRERVVIEESKVSEFIKNKVVLVSGAGGSIGSEIVRQLIKFQPKQIIGFEIDETELHNLSLELKATNFTPYVGDIRDRIKLEYLFNKFKIDIVFHAGAYKHVPLMEDFPEEAIKTNMFGTYNLAEFATKYGVSEFVNISTDKAVNPTSIMGATKRMAENICLMFNGTTKFVSVRFGNVLGSRGSVIPIFLEQIKNGGPITVTHPDMKRYFMTIPEAVLLVFQSATMGSGGEVFILDMGEPVKITKLAEDLIRLQGLEPYKDIEIKFSGLRAGEKLFEELMSAEEGSDKTYHQKVFVAKGIKSVANLDETLNKFRNSLNSLDREELIELLKESVPFYKK